MAPNNWHLRKVLQYSLNAWVGTCQITIRHLVRALHNLQSWGLDFLLSCMFYFASCSVWFQSSAPFILPASCSPHSKSFSLPASRPILPCGCSFLLNYEPTPELQWSPVSHIAAVPIFPWSQLCRMNFHVAQACTDWSVHSIFCDSPDSCTCDWPP